MRCNMRIIEALLQQAFFEICTVISARSVKAHYNLSMGNYKANKEAAVDWAETFVRNNLGVEVRAARASLSRFRS